MQFIIAYLGAAIVFFGLDFIWLNYVAKTFYRQEVGSLLLDKFQMQYAGIFYIFYIAGIVILAVMPHLQTGNAKTIAAYGLMLGLVAYGTYDMTNMSTLKGWSLKMSMVDMVWGGFLTSLGALGGYYAIKILHLN